MAQANDEAHGGKDQDGTAHHDMGQRIAGLSPAHVARAPGFFDAVMHEQLKEDQRSNQPMQNDLGAGVTGGGNILGHETTLSLGPGACHAPQS
jgi:hypothetical protein